MSPEPSDVDVAGALPPTWTLAASAFNWTPEVIRAERTAPDIAAGIVTGGIATTIELEPGQLWRSFPVSADAEVDALRRVLDGAGGNVSIVRSLGDEKEPLRGGAEMVREQLFEATFPRWFADGRPTITEVIVAS